MVKAAPTIYRESSGYWIEALSDYGCYTTSFTRGGIGYKPAAGDIFGAGSTLLKQNHLQDNENQYNSLKILKMKNNKRPKNPPCFFSRSNMMNGSFRFRANCAIFKNKTALLETMVLFILTVAV